jgi:hypothetical protein
MGGRTASAGKAGRLRDFWISASVPGCRGAVGGPLYVLLFLVAGGAWLGTGALSGHLHRANPMTGEGFGYDGFEVVRAAYGWMLLGLLLALAGGLVSFFGPRRFAGVHRAAFWLGGTVLAGIVVGALVLVNVFWPPAGG